MSTEPAKQMANHMYPDASTLTHIGSRMSIEREKWISRFTGHFGPPLGIEEYRAGSKSFRDMRDESLRHANNMLAEAEYYHADMFND